jgi:hypothetical protein
MEGAPFKRGETLKEDCNKCSNIPGCFLGGTLGAVMRNIEKRKCMETLHTTDWPCSAYEKPTPMGWSTKKTLALLFHDSLKNAGPSVALVTRQGPEFHIYGVAKIERVRMPVPNSIKSPRDEEQPGPRTELSV